MSQGFAQFTVNSGDALNTVYTIAHGLSKTPQIVLAWLNGQAANGLLQGTYQKSFGVGIKPTGVTSITQLCANGRSEDNLSLTQADCAWRNDCIGTEIPTGTDPTVSAGRLSLDSIDATNITFKLTEQFTQSTFVKIQFIGGNDLTWIKLGIYTGPIVPSTVNYTGLGFKPDFLLCFGTHLGQDPSYVQPDSGIHFGACDSGLNQFAHASGVNDAGGGGGGGSGRAVSYSLSGKFVSIINNAAQGLSTQGSVSSMDVDGFSINFDTATGIASGRQFAVLAVKGAQWKVGNFTTFTDAVSHNITGIGFDPESVIFSSANKVASTSPNVDVHEQWSLGILSGSTKSVMAIGQKGLPWSPGNCITWVDQDNATVYINDNVTPARASTAAAALIADGFSWQHGVADTGNYFVGYIAFATKPKAGVLTTRTVTVKPKGGGDYTSLNAALQGELREHKNLDTENIILEIDCYEGIDREPVVVPGQFNTNGLGFMTTSTNYILVKAVDGHAGLPVLDGSKYLLDINGNANVSALLIKNEFVRFRQLQVKINIDDGSDSSGGAYFIANLPTQMSHPTRWEFINCLLVANFTNGSQCSGFHPPSSAFDFSDMTTVFVNCVAYNFICEDVLMTAFAVPNGVVNQKIIRFNCFAYNCNQGFQDRSGTVVKDINGVAFGCDNGWNSGNNPPGPGPDSGWNFSTAGPTGEHGDFLSGLDQSGNLDARGTESSNALPCWLVDPIGGDYRPLEGVDTVLIGTGKDLSADADYPFNFDVTNATRSGSWTKGPWHIPVSSQIQAWLWSWAGAVTSQTFNVACRFNLDATVTLDYSTSPSFGTFSSLNSVSGNGLAKFAISGLQPNTRYYYRVKVGSVISPVHTVKTFPYEGHSASFTFAYGGCSKTGSNTNLYNAYQDYDPLFYLAAGDLHYWNVILNDQTLFRSAYDTVHNMPKRMNLFRNVPVDYVWDDHDMSNNNADKNSVSIPAAAEMYRKAFPHYPLPDPQPLSTAVYHAFTVGRVRIIVSDLRSQRSPSNQVDDFNKTMMGVYQKQWFKEEIVNAKKNGQFVIWISPVPWVTNPIDSERDNWGGYQTEQRELVEFLTSLEMQKQMVIFTGDMHSAAIDDGTHAYGFVTFNPYPENQTNATYTGVYTQGPITHDGTRLMGHGGIVTIEDNGKNISVLLRVIDELGTKMSYLKHFPLDSNEKFLGNVYVTRNVDIIKLT